VARKTSTPNAGPVSLDSQTALKVLAAQLERGDQLALGGAVAEAPYSSWVSETQHWIEQSFGEHSAKASEFSMAGSGGYVISSSMEPSDFAAIRQEALGAQLNKLRAFTNVLRQTCELQNVERQEPVRSPAHDSTKVFVVHGHDDGVKQTVARFLEKLGLTPVILHEQPNNGLTIIEKFEAYAGVAFAVVLLTPDDLGGPADWPREKQTPRARQNVVLELGYFLGKLGRKRVCALYKDGTEIPSDFQGVVYVPMDGAGAWRLVLGRELKQVIPAVDLNNAT
jgi:predicted nucleotide-binding protein